MEEYKCEKEYFDKDKKWNTVFLKLLKKVLEISMLSIKRVLYKLRTWNLQEVVKKKIKQICKTLKHDGYKNY